MGCSSGGCSTGGCSTGGCNKKNVFDFLKLDCHIKKSSIYDYDLIACQGVVLVKKITK